jgi:hypothetical protein
MGPGPCTSGRDITHASGYVIRLQLCFSLLADQTANMPREQYFFYDVDYLVGLAGSCCLPIAGVNPEPYGTYSSAPVLTFPKDHYVRNVGCYCLRKLEHVKC